MMTIGFHRRSFPSVKKLAIAFNRVWLNRGVRFMHQIERFSAIQGVVDRLVAITNLDRGR